MRLLLAFVLSVCMTAASYGADGKRAHRKPEKAKVVKKEKKLDVKKCPARAKLAVKHQWAKKWAKHKKWAAKHHRHAHHAKAKKSQQVNVRPASYGPPMGMQRGPHGPPMGWGMQRGPHGPPMGPGMGMQRGPHGPPMGPGMGMQRGPHGPRMQRGPMGPPPMPMPMPTRRG